MIHIEDATKKRKTRMKKKDQSDLKTLQDCHNLCKHIGGNTTRFNNRFTCKLH
ncbi:hypothetical protein MtrunA17_Chr7g0244291 [Medicago truncatula]|uniref:Uncharacterized protein n=1 Tax=Medicago truncatula TaxID=3880 RepID=A0A396H046_MEDTR|nr:hypothetical protein MtrunA17_Chr7g0244291 [Medicago truncatula]